MNDREQNILDSAYELLGQLHPQSDLDEAAIDAEFLFRFNTSWCNWVNKIRKMMRDLIGLEGDEPLSVEDGARWCVHLESNPGLHVGVEAGPDGTHCTMAADRGGYHCINLELHQRLDEALKRVMESGDNAELEHIHRQMWLEANQTAKVRDELERLALAYNVIPHKSEWDRYSPREIELRWKNLVNWVAWGKFVPSFRWPMTGFIENKTGDIRLYHMPGGHWRDTDDGGRVWVEDKPDSSKRMTLDVRVRTWALYFLTKRGGGRLSEPMAVDLWNTKFPQQEVAVQNYRNERQRLLSKGSKKRIT